MDIDNLSPETDRAMFALALAAALEGNEENAIGPTDTAFICEALSAYAGLIHAGLA